MKRTLLVTLFLAVAVFLRPSTANAGISHHGHHGHHSFHHTLHHIGHLFGGHHYGGHHYGGHHSGIHLSFGSGHHYGYGYPYRSYYSSYPRRTYSYYPSSSYRYYRSPTCRYISPVRTYAAPRSTSSYRVVYAPNPSQTTGGSVSSPLDLQPANVEPELAPPPEPVPPQRYEADENVVAQPQVLFTSLVRSGTAAEGPVQDNRTNARRLQTKSVSLPDVTSAALGVVAPMTRRLLSDDAIPWVAARPPAATKP